MSGLLQSVDQFRLVGLTALDLFVVVVVLFSTLLAMFRGMSREAFTLAAWLGAAAAAWFGWPQVEPLLEPYLADPTIRLAAAIGAAFVVPLVVLLIIAGIAANLIENSFLAPVDRGLGIVFGALRGLVLVLVTYLILLFLFPGAERPSWIMEARLRPLLDQGLGAARDLAPELPLPNADAAPTSGTRAPD
jgi:membrane protein required for colicin V production